MNFLVLLTLFALAPLVKAQLPAPKPLDPSPWNGSWKLNLGRSSAAAAEAGVPQVYRLTLGPGGAAQVPIRWEIPEIGEVVSGATDGQPMAILRKKPSPGLRLAVRKDGPATLLYSVYRNADLIGGGRMMLVDNGRAWVDLTWPTDRQDLASELLYEKQ